jgi:hypothetical protein
MKEHRSAKPLVMVLIMVFLVCTGAVGCGPTAGPMPEAPPGGPPPGGNVPGGPAPGGELQVILLAQPEMVPPGGCAMLHWEVSPPGEYRVLLNGQEVPLLGDQQVCPPGTTTYELLVETPSGPQVRTITVNVGGGPGGGPGPTPQGPGPQPTPGGPGPVPTGGPGGGCAGAPTFAYFTASPSTIYGGQQVQLSWGEVRNGTNGPLVGSVVLSPGGFGEVGSPGSRWASPTTTTTYRLTATGCGGTATKDVTVTVGGASAATATPHPGGPTATKQAGAATSTATPTSIVVIGSPIPMQPYPTATLFILTVVPMEPYATATPVPVWGDCFWYQVEKAGINSTEPQTYCGNREFLTGLDLDRLSTESRNMSPGIGQAECCTLATEQSDIWSGCNWVDIGNNGMDSHYPNAWCADGSYLVGLDLGILDSADPWVSPGVTQAHCCGMAGYSKWSSCAWVGVEKAGVNSHEKATWCPNGSFLAGLDLDSIDSYSWKDSPVVGQAYCCRP